MIDDQKPTLLLCTNGSRLGEAALEYGVWLARALCWEVHLLGVVEQEEQRASVVTLVEKTAQALQQEGIAHQAHIEQGPPVTIMARWAGQGRYLPVFGPLGRPIWQRLLQGRSFRHVLAAISTPILYAPRCRFPLNHLLLCVGGLEYSLGIERLSIFLAQRLGARLTVFHVVEPVTLDYPIARQVHERWERILETDTPQGRNLRRVMQEARAAGLEVDFKVLHGNPVGEIRTEARRGEYDLIAMGSPHSAQALRHLYMPNVTAEVAEACQLPVLSTRKQVEWFSACE